MAEPSSRGEVVIVGGGVAALETLMAPYVYEREPAAEPGPAPEGFVDLEVPLEPAQVAPVGR